MAKAQAQQFDPEMEDVEVEGSGPVSVQLTRDMLSPEHRAKAKAKLCQGQTPEVTEGKARVGLWLIEGYKNQFSRLRIVTGLPQWMEGEKGSVYTYTALATSGVTDDGREQTINKVVTVRFQGSALRTAQTINGLLFDAEDGQELVAVELGAQLVKGQKGSWYTPTVEPVEFTEAMQAEVDRVGL